MLQRFFLFIFLLLAANAGAQVKISDTIPSYKAQYDETFFTDTDFIPDTVLAADSNQGIMLFISGEPYAAYYVGNNGSVWPYDNHWVPWPLHTEGYSAIPRDIIPPGIGEEFGMSCDLVTISGRKLLQIDWDRYFVGISGPWERTKGMQLWDVHTQTCYFDMVMYESIEWSGRLAEDQQPRTETYEINYEIKNGKLKIRKNSFEGSHLRPGTYTIKGNHLVRK